MASSTAAGLLLALLAVPCALAGDSTYEGKSVAEWRAVLAGKDGKQRPRAAASLARMGAAAEEALPDLSKALSGSAKDEDLRVNAALALGKIAGPPDARFRSRIPGSPGEPGGGEAPPPGPEPAKPDPSAEKRAKVLSAQVVPALLKGLKDPCSDVRSNAALSLHLLGEGAAGAAVALVKAMGDGSRNVRRNAMLALGTVPGDPEKVLAALAKGLSDADATIANSAADGLASLGPKALGALESLRAALRKDCASPRSAMDAPMGLAGLPDWPTLSCNLCLALGRMGKEAAPALPEVFLALKAKNLQSRNAALQAVSSIRSDPEKSVAAVVPLLEDRAEEIRALAPLVLSDFGPDARSALPALEKLRDSSTGRVKQNAEAAIDRIGGKAVATGEGATAPETPAGYTITGGAGGGSVEVWR